MNTPSERFKAVRKELGLTQNEFAKQLNISQVAVYKLEEGQIKSISQEVTKILEDEFGINKIWLHFGEGMMYLDDTTNMYSVYNKLEYLSKLCEKILIKLGGTVTPSSEKRGRGRPRKNPEVTEAKTTQVKRGRGRPRKNPVEPETTNQPKRGRGRPRKNPEITEAKTTQVKRGRGRPRKNPIEPETTNQPKRGRGRPRKNPEAKATVVQEVKRGRGRPRKNVETIEAKTSPVKRGRGRPKKETTKVAATQPKRGRGRPKKNA